MDDPVLQTRKSSVTRAVQKDRVSLIEMEALAVEGIAWLQNQPLKSIECFISWAESVR